MLHRSLLSATQESRLARKRGLTKAAAMSSKRVGSRRFSNSKKKNPFIGTSLKRLAPNTVLLVSKEAEGPSGSIPAVELLARAEHRPSKPPCLASASLSLSCTDFARLQCKSTRHRHSTISTRCEQVPVTSNYESGSQCIL